MTLRVNFAEVEDRTFKPLEPGDYNFVIAKGEPKTTKSDSQKYPNVPAISLELRVKEGDPNAGRVLFYFQMLHPDFLPNLKQLLHCVGYDVSGELEWDSAEALIADLVNREVVGVVKYAKNDPSNNQISYFKPAGEGAESTLP